MPISNTNKPILITMGDPSGIGPEVICKALASRQVKGLANFLVIGDRFVIERAKRFLGLKIDVPFVDLSNVSQNNYSHGKVRGSFGRAAIGYIDKALELLRAKIASALVTAPINKSSVRLSGLSGFEGHTEYLAKAANTRNFAMMFVGGRLKVTLATRHIALRDVPKSLTIDAICNAILLTNRYLKRLFAIPNPKIGVSGLNPHAGDGGLFGDEEKRVIIPAIKKVAKDVSRIYGPLPPDIIFHEAFNKKFDAVVAMYHDQALIPFKMLYFESGVNLTLGLPFIRTSPDHGTAFDIAGKGIADPTSMIEAIKLACGLARRSRC